jgi:hypothetical protein
LLFGYLFFSLGLLVSTSFLGLRRYLRQRKVEMPLSLTWIWIGGGIAGVALVLLIVSLIPLPSGSQGLMDLPFRMDTETSLRPSQWGQGSEGKKEEPDDSQASKTPGDQSSKSISDAAVPGGKEPSDAKGDHKSKSESKSKTLKDDPNSKASPSSNEKGDSKKSRSNESLNPSLDKDKEKSKTAPQKNDIEKSKVQSQDPMPPNPERSMSISLSGGWENLLRWLVSGLLLVVIAYVAIRYRDEIHQAWLDLAAYWRGLFGVRSADSPASKVASNEEPLSLVRQKIFTDFENPFSRKASRWSPQRILLHFFEALEAWGLERRMARSAEETPEEYLRRLASKFPDQAESLHRFTQLYNRTAYANTSADPNEVKRLASLWEWLTAQS